MLDEIASADDEMIFRKTSNSAFISTNIDYVLCNLGVRSLIVAGLNDRPVRRERRPRRVRSWLSRDPRHRRLHDHRAGRHELSLIGIRGYCRQRTTDAVVAEITALTGSC